MPVAQCYPAKGGTVSQTVAGRVMPMIVVASVDAIRNFYVDTLGFSHVMGMVGKDGQLDFCTVVWARLGSCSCERRATRRHREANSLSRSTWKWEMSTLFTTV